MQSTFGEVPNGRLSWVIAGVGSIAMIFTFGAPLSYGVFREPFGEGVAVSSVALSAVFSLMLFTFFIGSGLVRVFAARLPARWILLTCAGATALLAPSLYFVESYLSLAVVFAVLGLVLGTVFVLVTSIVPRWFEARHGAATGLIFMGNGLGLFVLSPLWQVALEAVGVQRGLLAIMGTTAVAFGLARLTYRRPQWAAPSTATTGELLKWVGKLAGTRTFQLLFVGMGLGFTWYQLLAAYAVDLFAARGLTPAGASAAFGLISGVSIVSRIGGGYLADHVGSRRAFLGSLACAAVGLVLLFPPRQSLLAASVVLIGLGLGGCATLYVPLLMQTYSLEKNTAVIGVFNVAGGVGALGMPPLGTATSTYTDRYTVAIFLTVVLTVVSYRLISAATAA